MKKYLFTLLLVLLGITSAFAQKDSLYQCGTPDLAKSEMEKLPWYENNQFLYDFSYISKKTNQSMNKPLPANF